MSHGDYSVQQAVAEDLSFHLGMPGGHAYERGQASGRSKEGDERSGKLFWPLFWNVMTDI